MRRPSFRRAVSGGSLCSLAMIVLLAGGLLSGCGKAELPPPNPFEGKGFFPNPARRAGVLPREGKGGVLGAHSLGRAGDPLSGSFCGGTSLSRDGRRLSFRISGTGQGGESDGPDAVLHLARQDALRRALDCGGHRQIVRSFFDNLYHIGGREGQVLEQDLVETMAAFARYDVRSHSCKIAGSRLTCRVLLVGELRLEESDPDFGITRIALPQGGVLPEGSDLRMNLRVRVPGKEPVRLYLFDVDRRGEGVLLYPLPTQTGEEALGNQPLTLPPPGSQERFRVALPPGAPRTVERLFVIALRKGRLDVPVVVSPAGAGGVFYRIPDFRRSVLHRLFRLRGAGSLWTLREVPFEIVPKTAGGSNPLTVTPMIDTLQQRRIP